jgi:hypothetical protein
MKNLLLKIKTLLFALLLFVPLSMQSQVTATERIVQIILDAEAVYNAGSRLPVLADEMINLEAHLGQLGPHDRLRAPQSPSGIAADFHGDGTECKGYL